MLRFIIISYSHVGKLPFGIYFEMEKSGMNLNEIDTTDCDMSLTSLQVISISIEITKLFET